MARSGVSAVTTLSNLIGEKAGAASARGHLHPSLLGVNTCP